MAAPVAPSKGSLSRQINPADVPFTYGAAYNKSAFYPEEIATLRKPYILRDFRAQTLIVHPFQYQPKTQTLRIYTNLTLEIKNDQNGNVFNPLIRTTPLNTISAEYNTIYKQHFANYTQLAAQQKYTPLEENGSILIIAPKKLAPAMQPYIDWKLRTGHPAELVTLETIGAATSDIQAYIKYYYNNNKLTYLLLVGDAEDVPPMWSEVASGDSDVMYGFIDGDDHYPEILVGRFSASTTEEVAMYVKRTINYERNATENDDFYKAATFIASDQGPGDENEYDFEHCRGMRQKMLDYTYTTGYELYDGDQGEADMPGNPNPEDVINTIEAGIGAMLYTGHGSEFGCVTSNFSSGDIASLENKNRLPFFWSVACLNGAFKGATCFAEACTRASKDGEPTGFVAALMSSINQVWDEPMDAQDEMVALLTDSYANNIKRTFGGISFNGCMHMNDEYGSTGEAMTDTWNCFGDPSLKLRTNTPQPIAAQHEATLFIGDSELNITCDKEGALVNLILQNQLITLGKIENGGLNILFAPINELDTLQLTISGYNLIPYLAEIPVIPGSGPYVVKNNITWFETIGNANNIPEYGETYSANLTLKNIGVEAATNIKTTVSCTSPYITLDKTTENWGNIEPNTTLTIDNTFNFTIANNAPDQLNILFKLNITDDKGSTWPSQILLKINAPNLVISNKFTIDDSILGNNNNRLDVGEAATVYFTVENTGHAAAYNGLGEIIAKDAFATLSNVTNTFVSLDPGQKAELLYLATALPSAPQGVINNFSLVVTANAYTDKQNFGLKIGQIIAELNPDFNFETSGDKEWTITTTNPYEGAYCMQSGQIGHNKISTIQITRYVASNDSIAFYSRTDCELNYDFLHFYIDGNGQKSWSGKNNWARTAYAVSEGYHTFKWEYAKDEYQSEGADAAWLDFIELPSDYLGGDCQAQKPTLTPSAPVFTKDQSVTFTVSNSNTNIDYETIVIAVDANTTPPNKIVATSKMSSIYLNTPSVYKLTAINYPKAHPLIMNADKGIIYSPCMMASETVTIEITNQTVGMAQQNPEETMAAISVSPNPSTDQVTINSPASSSQINLANAAIRLYDAQGNEVRFTTRAKQAQYITISMQNLPLGIYMLAVDLPNSGATQLHKIIKCN
ncbi:MAG: T9SS type A sorting domain-containing protein [Sphingobacteriales bacterium]|nr:T9SS type A sorting domain-containing protein [Sphingobacteriales bacterium]